MNKKVWISILLLGGGLPCMGQMTIETCYQKAQENYPLIRQYDLIEKSEEYTLQNAGKGYVPQVSFSVKASYQSDVTKLPFNLSQLGIQGVKTPTLSKDQYGATVDINQPIWDGGAVRARRADARVQSDVETRNTEVSLYQINERINQLYFGILLVDAQIRQNTIYQEELKQSYQQVASYVENGIGNQADLDAVRIDQLKAEQSRAQFLSTRKAYIEMLGRWTGGEIDESTVFEKPAAKYLEDNSEIRRPELSLYDAQIRSLQTKDKESVSDLMPKIGLYFTGGYGKPGLNMLENKFSLYYVAGIKLSWNLTSFYVRRTSKRQLRENIQSVELQRETFLFDLDIDRLQKENEIATYAKQLSYDDEIIALRTSVKEASAVKMANGTLSGTYFMRDTYAEQLAVQDKIVHEVEWLLAIYEMKFMTNQE
ncbi:MAG: TolC family protein [Porphyromonadaceae bacterium]|nr:TolC family protein [Porphyromonadaceae bacterium]